jgi:acyl dehydratase
MSPKEYRVHGLYFEELEIGDTMITPGRTVTEADIVAFCGLSGDYNELHSNEEYAHKTLFGKRIAHGLLGLAIASGLAGRLGFMEGTAQAFMGLEWKFKHPLYIGDTVYLRATVTNKRETKRLGGGLVFIEATLLNQNEQVLQQGQWTLLIKSRPQA